MSDYLFGKGTLAQRAGENISKYTNNREEVIKSHIEAMKLDIEEKVLFASRRTGESKLIYNVSQFSLPETHPKIKICQVSDDETDRITTQITEWCKSEGLTVSVPGRNYHSTYYKTNLHLSWDHESKDESSSSTKTSTMVQIQ